jgi:glutaminyl-peptide cyclotransferase
MKGITVRTRLRFRTNIIRVVMLSAFIGMVPGKERAKSGLPHRIDSPRAFQYLREIVAFGPRPAGSPSHQKLETYLRNHLRGDDLQTDGFTAVTPIGEVPMTNLIAKFRGTKDGIIVIAGHYDTAGTINNFVGANDGGSSAALLLELANQLRNKNRQGYSVWLVWLDGEEAMQQWSPTDGLYGSRHLAEKWKKDGADKEIKACLIVDMIGDADLNIEHDLNSTPWLEEMLYRAATDLGLQSHFFRRTVSMEDDHASFVEVGLPAAEIIDYDYGNNNALWHTAQDTIDKISPQSLQIVGDVLLKTIRLLNDGLPSVPR